MSTNKVEPVPAGMRTVTPHLICDGAAAAIEFYKKAFGATEICRMPSPDGKIMHAAINIGDSMVMLVDQYPDWGCMGPGALKGSSVTIHLQVEDADGLFKQAVDAGAKVIMPIEDAFWGDRYGKVEDPFGHHWSIATHIRDLTPEQIQEAMKAGCGGEA